MVKPTAIGTRGKIVIPSKLSEALEVRPGYAVLARLA
jgi:bifunctional DNA-binding transcriptional regulator/antitoxin component of YhaV-PrlF toxin-antitoxin module